MERFILSLQQDLLTLLVHSDEHGKTISKIVSPSLFEGDYRSLAERALAFWQQYNSAPKQHIADLFSEILNDKHDRRAQTYRRILIQMIEVKDQINVEFVLCSMTQFIRLQRAKETLLKVAENLDAKGVNGLQDAEHDFRSFLSEQTDSLDPGLHLNEFDKVLEFINKIQTEFDTGIKELDEAHIVPMRGKILLFIASAKRGKCVAEGEHILLADGRYIPIESFKEGDLVSSYDSAQDRFLSKAASLSENGIKEVFRVQTRGGRCVLLTAEHRLLTKDGWKPLSSIDLGDLIAVPAECSVFGSDDLPVGLLKIIGYLIADGGLTQIGYHFTKQDKDIVFDMEQCLSEFGYKLSRHEGSDIEYVVVNKPEFKGKHLWLNSFIREVGLSKKKSNQKFVPECFFTLRKELIAVFLASLFTCDGSVYKNSKNSSTWVFEYSTTSEKLAKQVHHLLSRFGIISTLRKQSQIISEKLYYSWSITILSQAQLRKFDNEIGLFFTKGKLLKLAISGTFDPKKNRTGIDRGKIGNLLFDKLVSVESVGMKKTYDLTVEGTQNFIAENVLVHNTHFLVHLGKRAFLRRKKVLHISLEIEEPEVAQRYYQALFGASKWEDTNKVSTFRYDNQGDLDQIVQETVDVPFTFASQAIREELNTRISHFGTRIGNIIIKRFPMSSLTLNQLEGYLEALSTLEKYDPDMVIIDYPKIMKLNTKDLRISLGNLFEELRGLAQRRNFALPVVHQGNRESANAEFVRSTHAAEDWSIIGTCDAVITYSQTAAERKLGLARLFVDAARSETDRFGVLITQSYKTGQFVLESTRMSDSYAHLLERMDLSGVDDGGHDDASQDD